jgi:hypothetical protein
VATWDDVGRIALALPETNVRSSGGHIQWRVRDKLIAWERPLRKADLEALGANAPSGPILGVRTEHEGVKLAMIDENPEVFFTTPHFDGYPAVLMRIPDLAGVDRDELEELVVEAWLTRAQKRVAKAWLEEHGA